MYRYLGTYLIYYFNYELDNWKNDEKTADPTKNHRILYPVLRTQSIIDRIRIQRIRVWKLDRDTYKILPNSDIFMLIFYA